MSSSPVFQPSDSGMARTPATHSPTDAISSDPSVRISASDISATFTKPPTVEPAESAQRRHPDLDAPGIDMWMPGLPPTEPTMPWPIPATESRPAATEPDPYRSPFADSPFTDPLGDPDEPAKPRHSVDADAGHSVLSSLGITAGSTSGGGGRRRAREDQTREDQPAERAQPVEQSQPTHEPKRDDPSFGDGSWVPLRYRRHELPAPHSPIGGEPLPVPSPTAPAEPVAEPEPHRPPRPDAAAAAQSAPAQPAPVQPQERSTTRPSGRRRRSVQLADLLTEAMMAYQTAQDTNEARQNPLGQDPSASLAGPTSLPTPLAGPVGLDPAVGDEPGYPGPARRGDPHLGDSRWHTTRWDPSDERP